LGEAGGISRPNGEAPAAKIPGYYEWMSYNLLLLETLFQNEAYDEDMVFYLTFQLGRERISEYSSSAKSR
jgi:hypothetical protein